MSQTYTIKNEQEEYTFDGINEMSVEGDTEDENISKRPTIPLTPNDAA